MKADALAIYSDWLNTGNDIRTALDKFKQEVDAQLASTDRPRE
jgi:hypothetical protein